MNCVIKWCNRFINSIRVFSFVSKCLSPCSREKTAGEMSLKEWIVKTGSASATP